MQILIADRQDITRLGLIYIVNHHLKAESKVIHDKAELINRLKADDHAMVVMDYQLFDINDTDELLILAERFKNTWWVLFSEELTTDTVRCLLASCPQMSVALKESTANEIRSAIDYALQRRRFICQRMTELLIAPPPAEEKEERIHLTKTETEILQAIASGLTTREIAERRFSSFHTINTHRKNIFRKIGVNTAHEATRYALRAGLVDPAEYYI